MSWAPPPPPPSGSGSGFGGGFGFGSGAPVGGSGSPFPALPDPTAHRQLTLQQSWGLASSGPPTPVLHSQPSPMDPPPFSLTPPMPSSSSPMPPSMAYQPTMPQMMHAQFGRQALDDASSHSQRDLTARWRMPAVDDGHGGHGVDEMQRTSYATRTLSAMSSHASDDQLVRSAAILSMDRVDTSALAWFTSDGELGGHPGALRSPSQMLAGRGTTNTGHNSRDTARVAAVSSEPGLLSGAARAKVETVRTMSTPYEEFQDRATSGFSTTLTHAKAGDLAVPGNFRRMAAYVGDTRELIKWDAASEMMHLGTQGHVPPVMRDYLVANENIARAAAAHWHRDLGRGLAPPANTATRSQAGALAPHETLGGTHQAAESGTRPRALSNPRQMQGPPSMGPPKEHA